jgi:hypothetical protein
MFVIISEGHERRKAEILGSESFPVNPTSRTWPSDLLLLYIPTVLKARASTILMGCRAAFRGEARCAKKKRLEETADYLRRAHAGVVPSYPARQD